jgi:hypothetical protein
MTQWHHIIRRVRLVILMLTCLVGVSAIPASPALAATECNGTLDGVTIQGNLTVPAGVYCTLTGSTVTGNVVVDSGGAFRADYSTIGGNLSSDGAEEVLILQGTVVKGKVTVSGVVAQFVLGNSQVNGNVTHTGSASYFPPAIDGSTIGGNLTFSGNSNGSASPEITDNTVGGNLICEGNDPAPTAYGNVVSGRNNGQCAAL